MAEKKIRTFADFEAGIKNLVAYQVRKQMDRDIHVLIFREIEFRKLVRIHKAEIKRIVDNLKKSGKSKQLQKSLLDIYTDDQSINKVSQELYNNFISIFDAALKKRGGKKIAIKKQTKTKTSYTFYAKSNIKTQKRSNIYSVVQNVQRDVRRTLLNNSKKGSTAFKVLSSVVIVGVAIVSEGNVNLAQAKKIADARKTGAQLGHTRGAAAVTASEIRNLLNTVESNASILSSLKGKTTRKVKEVDVADARITLNNIGLNIGKEGFKGNIYISVLTLESTKVNLDEGKAAQKLLSDLKKYVLENGARLFEVKHSKSYKDAIEDSFIELFLTGKKRKIKYPNKVKNIPVKVTGKVQESTIDIKSKSEIGKFEKELQLLFSQDDQDLNEKIPYLNRRLHDKIQQNMGKGRSKKILNYRTGRFARSAEIERFTPSREKGAVNAQVKYMRFPYGTFEPGGRLHLPGRNPERIFARSIRQLLQEEKIATLRRVKVQLRG